MNNIQILLSNPHKELKDLPKKHLLIDTNFLIDSVKYSTQFKELLELLSDIGFTLVSIEATLVEFAKGSKSLEDYSKKVEYYKTIINRVLPLEPSIHDNVSNITRVLLKKGGQLSYVDCLLLGTTMKYKTSLYFLTKDRSDVPISIFNPVATIMIETQDNNCTFYIYEYNEKPYGDLLIKRIEEIPF
jgi:predicted nucleic acid-binding protein